MNTSAITATTPHHAHHHAHHHARHHAHHHVHHQPQSYGEPHLFGFLLPGSGGVGVGVDRSGGGGDDGEDDDKEDGEMENGEDEEGSSDEDSSDEDSDESSDREEGEGEGEGGKKAGAKEREEREKAAADGRASSTATSQRLAPRIFSLAPAQLPSSHAAESVDGGDGANGANGANGGPRKVSAVAFEERVRLVSSNGLKQLMLRRVVYLEKVISALSSMLPRLLALAAHLDDDEMASEQVGTWVGL